MPADNQIPFDIELAILDGIAPLISDLNTEILPKLDKEVNPKAYQILASGMEGDLENLRKIAIWLYHGEKLPKNKDLGRSLLKNLAFGPDEKKKGLNPASAYSLAKIYIKDENFAAALLILQKLLSIKFSPAYALMGNIYEYGYGVSPSLENANTHYETAQNLGHIYAIALRAKLYLSLRNPFKKIRGIGIFLRFMIRTIVYEYTNPKHRDEWSLFF